MKHLGRNYQEKTNSVFLTNSSIQSGILCCYHISVNTDYSSREDCSWCGRKTSVDIGANAFTSTHEV